MKELKPKGATARGRNGSFGVASIEIWPPQYDGGQVYVAAYSDKIGYRAPLHLYLSKEDARALSELLREVTDEGAVELGRVT